MSGSICNSTSEMEWLWKNVRLFAPYKTLWDLPGPCRSWPTFLSFRGYTGLSFKASVMILVSWETRRAKGFSGTTILCWERGLNNAPKLGWGKNSMAIFTKSLDPWTQDIWVKMGPVGTHESPLYRHVHFMLVPYSLGHKLCTSLHEI